MAEVLESSHQEVGKVLEPANHEAVQGQPPQQQPQQQPPQQPQSQVLKSEQIHQEQPSKDHSQEQNNKGRVILLIK